MKHDLFNRPYAEPETYDAIHRREEKHRKEVNGAYFVGLIFCVFLYFLGKQQGQQAGRLEVLREVGPISNQPALMKQYLQKQGVYMFSSAELDAVYR